MSRILASSAEVVNSATSMTDMINAVLAGSDPDYDWSPDIAWWPGDPLYPHPEIMFDEETGEAYTQGNYVRPMIQVLGERNSWNPYGRRDHTLEGLVDPDCEKCDVSGAPSDRECWMCGGPINNPLGRLTIPKSAGISLPLMGAAMDLLTAQTTATRMNMERFVRTSLDVEFHGRSQIDMYYSAMFTNNTSFSLPQGRRSFIVDLVEVVDDVSTVTVMQEDVDATQELPELIRNDITCPEVRRNTPTIPAGVPIFTTTSSVRHQIQVPNEIPTQPIIPKPDSIWWAPGLGTQRNLDEILEELERPRRYIGMLHGGTLCY